MEPKAMRRSLALSFVLFLLISPSSANSGSCYNICCPVCALTRLPKFLCKLACKGGCVLGDGVAKVIAHIIGDRAECIVDCVESSCLNLKPDGLDMKACVNQCNDNCHKSR